MKKYFLIGTLWICTLIIGKGQNPQLGPITPEYLYAQLDRELYVGGEQLWYAIYFLQPSSTIRSEVVHVDMVDPQGNVLAQHQHPVQGNRAFGDFFLDPSWDAGMYTFRVYTLWNQNFAGDFSYTRNLPIYRLDTEIPQVSELRLEAEEEEEVISSPAFPIYSPRIELVPKSLEPRDSLEIMVNLSGISSDEYPIYFSASVISKEGPDFKAYYPSLIDRKQGLTGKSEERITSQQLYPPQKGLVAWGDIQVENPDEAIAFALTDSTSVRFPSIEEGSFVVEFPDFHGKQSIQVFQEKDQEVAIQWGSPQDLYSPQPNASPLPFNKAIEEAILLSRKRKLFQQLFELPSLAKYPKPKPSRFSLRPDQSFSADDYIAFKSMEEFMRETVYIRLKGKESNKSIRLLNMDRNLYYKEKPLFLVNGYLTQNEEEVLGIPWRDVERVELFLSSFRLLSQFATLGSNGVLSVYTPSGKTPNSILNNSQLEPIQGFYTPLEFTPPRLVNGDGELALPDLREVEYWNPNFVMKAPGNMGLATDFQMQKENFDSDWKELRVRGILFMRKKSL